MKKLKFVFTLFCLSGCLYQIQKVSSNYFKYQTVTTVSVQMDDSVNDPQLSVCFNLTSLFTQDFIEDKIKLQSERQQKMRFPRTSKEHSKELDLRTITV